MNGGKKLLGFHLQLGNGTMHASVIPTMQIGMGGGRQMARHPGLHNTHTSCNFYAENGNPTNTLDVRIGSDGEVHSIESTQVNHLETTSTNIGLLLPASGGVVELPAGCPASVPADLAAGGVELVGDGVIKLINVSAKNTVFKADPAGAKFSNTTINISGGDFTGAQFNTGTLRGEIANSVLTNATLQGDFLGLVFKDVTAISSKFKCSVVGSGLQIEGGNFTSANFSYGGSYAGVVDAIFNDVDFTNADFRSARFIHPAFSNVTLRGAKLAAGTIPYGASWVHTICPDGTNSDNNGNTCENHL
jgi:hypothetical protein